jgi:hypothetical protein
VGPRKTQLDFCSCLVSFCFALCCFAFCVSSLAGAQVLTVGTNEVPHVAAPPFHATHIALSKKPMRHDNEDVVLRTLLSQVVFAVRPIPMGHRGLELHANGKLSPSGNAYQKSLYDSGVAAMPGDRIVITEVKISQDSISMMLNGGPDYKHRFLRHVQVGLGGGMNPVTPNSPSEPSGAHVTLIFNKFVPVLTQDQLTALLTPLFDFHSQSPAKTFVETLPPRLQDAILHHEVLLGMSPKLVSMSKGRPDQRLQEDNPNGLPFEEWIYGQAPEPVEFVRFDNGRVVRLEIADVGKPPIIQSLNPTDAANPDAPPQRTVELGDVNPKEQNATVAPPTLRNPGEQPAANSPKKVKLPDDDSDDETYDRPDYRVGAPKKPSTPATPSSTTNPGSTANPSPTTNPSPNANPAQSSNTTDGSSASTANPQPPAPSHIF